MKRLRQLILDHRLAIFFAVIISIIVVLPQIYFRIDHRNDGIYQGIELIPDSPWSPRIREIQDGNGFGSIYYKDGKGDPYLFQPLGSAMVAYMGKLFFLDINNTLLLSRVILPFISFLLLYGFVFLLAKSKLAALSSAAIILLTESVQHISGIKSVLRGISPRSFIDLARPAHPAFIFIPFFAFLFSFWIFYQKKNWRWGIVSAFFLGINFYNYFYTWSYLYAFGGILVLLFLFQKKWREALTITLVWVGGVIVAIPYIWNVYQASLYASYEEVGLRFGIVQSHEPLFVGYVVIITLIIFFFWFPKSDAKNRLFGFALLLAPFVTMNQQIITGKVLQPGHYHWYFHKPIAIIFILIIIFYWLNKKNLFVIRKILAITIITLSFAVGAFVQAKSYFVDYEGRDGGHIAIQRQKYGPVMDWLNKNTEKNEVVFANEETSHITVIYTPLNVFYHRVAFASLSATKERLLETIFAFYRLRGVTKEDVREVFFDERAFLSWNIYGIHYREVLGSYEAIPDEKVEEIIASYEKILSIPTAKWLEDVWSRYDVNYVVWDKKLDPVWYLERFPFLEEKVTFGDINIYKFHPESKGR